MTARSLMPNDDVCCTLEDHRCPSFFYDIRRLLMLFLIHNCSFFCIFFPSFFFFFFVFLDSELIPFFMRVHY